MMFTILVNQNNELVVSPTSGRIMQRSNLVDSLHFLVDQKYNDIPMKDCTVVMEYILPVSKKYRSEFLVASEELYKDYVEYTLPFDTKLTSEAGDIEVQLTFLRVDLDNQEVRKTSVCKIPITPIADWAQLIPDEALTALDQKVVKLMAANQQLIDLQQSYIDEKADDLSYEDGKLSLTANGHKIGTEHAITSENDVVDFSVKSDGADDGDFDVVTF